MLFERIADGDAKIGICPALLSAVWPRSQPLPWHKFRRPGPPSGSALPALKTARAWRMMIIFKGLFDFSASRAVEELEPWRLWAARSKLAPIVEFARMLKKHWDGVTRWLMSGLTNGLLESINSLIQAAKSRARGYRTTKNLKIMTNIVAGKIGQLPT